MYLLQIAPKLVPAIPTQMQKIKKKLRQYNGKGFKNSSNEFKGAIIYKQKEVNNNNNVFSIAEKSMVGLPTSHKEVCIKL